MGVNLSLTYYYKGSTNGMVRLIESDGSTHIYTDYNELITTVQTTNGLVTVIQDLASGKYA